jgi:hypothetical protein
MEGRPHRFVPALVIAANRHSRCVPSDQDANSEAGFVLASYGVPISQAEYLHRIEDEGILDG